MKNFDMQKLCEIAGGSFRLTVLMQKRLKELKGGAKKLVEMESPYLLDIVCQEILEKKISLAIEEEEDMRQEREEESVKDLFQNVTGQSKFTHTS